MANNDLAATLATALQLDSGRHQAACGASLAPESTASTLRLALLAATLIVLAGGIPARANVLEICEKADSSNPVCNASFEALDADGSDLPQGWTFATGHELSDSSDSDAYASYDRPRSGEGVLKVVRGGDTVVLDSYQLVPITPGVSYRLGMDYRFDRFGDDPRGRVSLQVIYLDENRQPIRHTACSDNKHIACFSDADCGEQGLCTAVSSSAWAGISTGYDPAVDGVWHHTQGSVEPGRYQSFPDFEPVDAAYAKLRIWTNPFFEGEVSLDNLSLAVLNESVLSELPEGSFAYDLMSRPCTPGDADCEAAALGFETLLVGPGGTTQAACGFSNDPAEGSASGTYPTALLGRNVDRPRIECKLAPNTDYVVSLYMGGHWRIDPSSEIHQVKINESADAVVDESRVCRDAGPQDGSVCSSDADCGSGVCAERDVYEDVYFSKVNESLVTPALIEGKGYAIYDEYVWPRRYRRHNVAVRSDGNGSLRIAVGRGAVGALVLIPGTLESADLSALDDYENQMREEFVSRWARYVEPEDMGLPVVQGDYQPTSAEFNRGFVLFHRDWMDFVEFSSRPETDDVITSPAHSGLSLRATPGEYEPITFSVWPLRDLDAVSLEVSDLRTSAGDTIPAEAVSTWYLQQRPQRIDPPTAFGFVSGFLPEWAERDLYAGITQRAWLNVKVPEGTPAGVYSGTLTLVSANAESVALSLEIEVLPFELIRPARTHVMRWAAGNGLIVPVDKALHRRAAMRDLKEHGVQPEIGIWWPSLLAGSSDRRRAGESLSINWDARTFAGTPDEQVASLLEADARGSVWIDSGSILRMGLLDAFGDDGGSEWSIADTEAWLNAIEARFGPVGYGFEEILLHITAEESHFLDSNGQTSHQWYAWLDFLAFVAERRSASNWPHIKTTHSFNTNQGQDQALAEGNIDLPALGMFHGVDSDASDQISQAQGLGNPFLLYGVRGRLVPGFYLWRAGASGTFHEWYTRSDGALNDDWDNTVSYGAGGEPQQLLHEGPAWSNTQYSQDGTMVGSWMWEEIREAIDDDAYMNTLEAWIAATADDRRSEVIAAREEALEALAWIASQVDLDAVGDHDPEEAAVVSKRFSRSGLSLVRNEEPDVNGFHQLRERAIDAIAALVLADASAPAPVDSPAKESIASLSGSATRAATSAPAAAPQSELEATAPVAQDLPSEEHDAEVVTLPEPGAAATGLIVALMLGVLANNRRANLR